MKQFMITALALGLAVGLGACEYNEAPPEKTVVVSPPAEHNFAPPPSPNTTVIVPQHEHETAPPANGTVVVPDRDRAVKVCPEGQSYC